MGNYSGTPTHSVSVLDGLKAEFPQAKISFVPGTQFLRNDGDPVPDNLLTTPDGKPGLKADYGSRAGMDLGPGTRPTPLTSRVESNLNLTDEQSAGGGAGQDPPWRGVVGISDAAGNGRLSVGRFGGRVSRRSRVDGKKIAQVFSMEGVQAKLGRVHLEHGQKVSIAVTYGKFGAGKPHAQLLWARYNPAPSPEAVAAARSGGRCDRSGGHHQRARGRRNAGERAGISGRRPHQPRSAASRKKLCWKPWRLRASRWSLC